MRSLVAAVVSVVAVVLGVLIARNCDAADWQQGVMLFVLPVVAGAGVGFAVGLSRSTRGILGLVLAVVMAIVVALAFIALWGGECSR